MKFKSAVGICLLLTLVSAGALARQSEVADAAQNRDRAAVRALLDQKAAEVGLTASSLRKFLDFTNATQGDGATALHWAAYNRDIELAETLIAAGADAGAYSRNGSTPLWLAATNGDAAMIEALLDAGADPNEDLPLGRTPLMIAARTGSLDAVEILIDRGANLEARDSERGTTPVMWAADEGHAETIALLIEHGADFTATSDPVARGGRTAALGKSGDPRSSVVRQVTAILEEQALPDLGVLRATSGLPGQLERGQEAEGGRPLTPDQIRAAAGADGFFAGVDDVAAQGGGGRGRGGGGGFGGGGGELEGGGLTALIYAARSNSLESARVLLEAGADVNQPTRYGWTPLLTATQNRNYQLARFLIENGADVNLANKGGWTNLYLATDNRNVEGGDYPTRNPDMDDLGYIRHLLDQGAAVNARMTESTETRTVFTNQWLDENGATAFLRASQSGDVELMRLLLEHDANPQIFTVINVTPLAAAAGIGWVEGVTNERSVAETVEAVKLLLELGIDPNVQAETGRVALHGAGHKGATEVARLLVEAGAQMDIRDYGNTDNRGSAELAAHTWMAVDYADGLVRVGVQSAIPHPETGLLLRELMAEAGLEAPPMGRTLDSICITEACDLFPVEVFGEGFADQFDLQ